MKKEFVVIDIPIPYGFKNLRIGDIMVYTINLRFTNMDATLLKRLNEITITETGFYTIINEKTAIFTGCVTSWFIMAKVRRILWSMCKEHAQNKLNEKYN